MGLTLHSVLSKQAGLGRWGGAAALHAKWRHSHVGRSVGRSDATSSTQRLRLVHERESPPRRLFLPFRADLSSVRGCVPFTLSKRPQWCALAFPLHSKKDPDVLYRTLINFLSPVIFHIKRSFPFPRLNNKKGPPKAMDLDPATQTRVQWQNPITQTQQRQPAIDPTATHEFQSYNHHNSDNDSNLSYPPQLASMPQQSPPHAHAQPPSFPPGAGPNDPTEQHAHYPPGHAYRRSHSNSPFRHTSHPSPYPIPSTPAQPPLPPMSQGVPPPLDGVKQETAYYTPTAAELYNQALASSSAPPGDGSGHYPPSTGVPRLPPILQVEKKQVTTSATQAASASRRRNEAHFICPVPGCGSTFTRRFNLRGPWPWCVVCAIVLVHLCVVTRSFAIAYRRAPVCVRVSGL